MSAQTQRLLESGGNVDWQVEAGLGDLFSVSGCKPLQQGQYRCAHTWCGSNTSWLWLRVPAAEPDFISLLAPASCCTGYRAPTVSGKTFESLSTERGLCFPQVLSFSKASKPALSVIDPEHLIVSSVERRCNSRASLWQLNN